MHKVGWVDNSRCSRIYQSSRCRQHLSCHHVTLTFLILGEADSKKKGDGERNKGEDNDELLDPVAVEGAEQDQGVRPV